MPKSALHATWGARLRDLREGKRLSQRALGAEVGISGSAVHRIETGDFAPTDELRIRLAQVLGVRVEDVFAYPDTSAPAGPAVVSA